MRYLLFFAIILLAACQQPAVINTLEATITGAEADSKLTIKGHGYNKEFEIKDGLVKDTFKIDKAGVYSMIYQRTRLQTYLEPGQTVSFSGEANDLEQNVVFQGEHEKVWSYFKEKKKIMDIDLSPRQLYSMEPDVFLETLKTGTTKLSELLSSASLPAAIVAIEKEGIDLHKKHELYVYPLAADKEVANLAADFKDPLAGITFQDETKYLENPSYAKLVNTHFSIEMNRDTTGDYEDVFMKKIAALPAGNIRNDLLYGTMQYLLGPNDRLDEFLSFFKEHSTDEEDIAKMVETHASLQGLMKGNVSPAFDYENYKGGNSTLADYKGKYVYIDVWATWCGPCKAEIPSLKEKEAKYHDSNIEFVSISIDKKEAYDAWRTMVKDKELGGSQLIADNAWRSNFVQDYKINGIPRFILVDPEGKIVSADAPRPSSDKFDEKLKDLDL